MVFRALLALVLAFSVQAWSATTQPVSNPAWQGYIPKVVNDPGPWTELLPELMKRGMYYGALAGAYDMINFFSDLPTKQLAYQTIVQLVDLGYPFSTRAYFVPGDIDPPNRDEFSQSYFLYKGIVNLNKGMTKWADSYFDKVDKDNFPKYLFFQATQAYAKGNLDDAVKTLRKMLASIKDDSHFNLAKKAARTLARIYYEQKHYHRASDIYQSFLLQTSPVAPDDWLEAAWNFYQLKDYNRALGMLYNLESKAASQYIPMEKYILRALIYREMCSSQATYDLIKTFNQEYGRTIYGIKMGEPLNQFPILGKLDYPDAQQYRYYVKSIDQLMNEYHQVRRLPRHLQGIARYVYISALKGLIHTRGFYRTKATEAVAKHLVILGESLRFLQFDVVREKYNPDAVFAETPAAGPLIESNQYNFTLHWPQWGDFWRDERLDYRGILTNKCD